MLKLFVPALLGVALLAPVANAQPISASRSIGVELSRESVVELTATKKKAVRKPAAKKASVAKKAVKVSRPAV